MNKIFECLRVGLITAALLSPAFLTAQEVKNPTHAPAVLQPVKPLNRNQAKRNSVISGEFKLETATKQKDPYQTGEDAALSYIEGLQSSIKSLSGGNISKGKDIEDAGLHFLTTAYLYCSVNNGICAYILDSLLEADVINGRIDKKDTCPTLRRFWKEYIDNDLEGRHKYATKIGFLAETGEFNTKSRPKYIKCADTVKKEREGEMSDSEYFKARYASGAKLDAVTKTAEYIQSLKTKNINVFTEVANFR
jgi:hypothetical protein